MEEIKKTDVKAALERVLEASKMRFKTANQWYTKAGLTESTGRSAFGGNPTVKTLEKLAEAAGLSLAEMLEYGDPDWQQKRRARAFVASMTDEEAAALARLLERRAARDSSVS